MLKIKNSIFALAFLGFSNIAQAHGQHAHVHGLVEMDVAVEKQRVSVFIQSPLDNFLGFEHAARTPEQIQRAQNVWVQLQNAHALIEADKAAQCQRSDWVLESDVLENAQKMPQKPQNSPKPRAKEKPFWAEVAAVEANSEEHADLYLELHWNCKTAPHTMNFQALLQQFGRIEKIQVQIAAENGQFLRNVDIKNSTITWP